LTSEKKSAKSAGFALRLDIDTIKHLDSGSCIIPSDQTGNRVVVCKEGNKIKIFTITEEKK